MDAGYDFNKLDPSLQAKMKEWEKNSPATKQLLLFEDMADILQELLNTSDKRNKDDDKRSQHFGALLVDIRETLAKVEGKEAPEMPDFSKPIIAALKESQSHMLNAFSKAMSQQPEVHVQAPDVTVPELDTKEFEKLVKQLPDAFKQAIKLIPKVDVPETDFSPLVDKLETMSQQLESIDTASRLKPQFPNNMKVTNSDGSAVGGFGILPIKYDDQVMSNPDGNNNYQTITYKQSGVTVATLALTYDAFSNVTRVQRTS
jgi:hypothetical protein